MSYSKQLTYTAGRRKHHQHPRTSITAGRPVALHPSHYYVIRDTRTGRYLTHDPLSCCDAEASRDDAGDQTIWWRKSWHTSEKFITIGPTDGRVLCQQAIARACETFGLDASVIAPHRVNAPRSLLTDLLVKQWGITRAEIDAPGLPVVGEAT